MTASTDTITAKGHNGTITFDGTTITIKRGRLSLQNGSTKHIPLSSVQAIQYTPPKLIRTGYLSFTLPGSIEGQGRRTHHTFEAFRDENAVVIRANNKRQRAEFEALYRAIAAAKGITV